MSTTTERVAPLADCTAFQRDILVLLADDESQPGVSIQESLESFYGEVQPGRLYPNLDRLADRGLVSKREYDGRTNHYALTRRGRSAVEMHVEWGQTQLEGSR